MEYCYCLCVLLFNVEFISAASSVVFVCLYVEYYYCLYVEYCYSLMLSLLVLHLV